MQELFGTSSALPDRRGRGGPGLQTNTWSGVMHSDPQSQRSSSESARSAFSKDDMLLGMHPGLALQVYLCIPILSIDGWL